LSSGVHTISVSVTPTETTSGSDSSASVVVGSGSLTVEEVRAVNSGDGIEFN